MQYRQRMQIFLQKNQDYNSPDSSNADVWIGFNDLVLRAIFIDNEYTTNTSPSLFVWEQSHAILAIRSVGIMRFWGYTRFENC